MSSQVNTVMPVNGPALGRLRARSQGSARALQPRREPRCG